MAMLRVIIVDDERTVRVAMRTMIRWEENGLELAGTAADGNGALQLIDASPIDIVITDLKMPNMNGIELLRALAERGFSGRSVVLSNHGDYELVREAMKIGAVDYLLKLTLRPDDLLQAIGKAGELLSRDRKDKEHRLRLQHELIESQLEKRGAAWRELLLEDDGGLADAIREAERCSIPLDRLQGHLLHVSICRYREALATGKLKNRKLLHFSVINIMKEIASNVTDMELVDLGDGQYAALLYDTAWTEEDADSLQLASHIVRLIRTYLNLDVNVTISGRFDGLGGLREQYRHCRKAAAAGFYKEAGFVQTASSVTFDEGLTGSRFPDWSSHFKAAFEEENEERLEALMPGMMKEMSIARCLPELVCNVFLILFTDLEHIVAKWRKLNDRATGESSLDGSSMTAFRQRIMHAESMGQLAEAAQDALLHLSSMLRDAKRHSCRKEVLQLIAILHERMEDKMTLDMLATSVNLNESYLCRIFKQDTGKSIFQYINELKIGRAVELLKQRDARVKEVALSVGIEDPFYFNRLFKKTVGVSPSEYRKNVLEGHHT
jgi:two-component system response regulator YesN